MSAVWEFLENFFAGVYVADINTHELIYMNTKAREWFHVSSAEDYQGKKCYAVLQNFSMPCPFCTNTQLTDNQFYEWNYYNPVVNKTFHLKDYIVPYQGRKFRVEIAIPDDALLYEQELNSSDETELNPNFFINKCLMATHSTSDPSVSLELMLQYIGSQLGCEHIYLYEQMNNGEFLSTYHWVPEQEQPFDHHTLDVSDSSFIQNLYRNEVLIFSDADEHLSNPSQFLESHDFSGVHTLVLSPVLSKGKIIALLRMDNPTVKHIRQIAGTIKVLSHFIGSILLRRDLVAHLEELSYHDSMTQLLNRHALNRYLHSKQYKNRKSLGLIYCDLIGLKRINDNLGHNNGDRLILQASHILTTLFLPNCVYRIGGDEFLVICQDISKDDLQHQIAELRIHVEECNCAISIGSTWSDSLEDDFSHLMTLADDKMYQDKLSFYENHQPHEPHIESAQSSAFQSFLQHYYFDAEAFFHSLSMPDVPFYLYCGDVQRNIYYISDNLRDNFQFDSNLVYDFVTQLEQRIYEPDRRLHMQDTQAMFREKRTAHDIRYRIYDRNGQLIWIHCRGILTWDEQRTTPLFFSGSMISLQDESETDTLTGLMNRSCALRVLSPLCQNRSRFLLLCFDLRNFSDINLSEGRSQGDSILCDLAHRMKDTLGKPFQLFRLDGVHFLVLTELDYDINLLTNTIRGVIQEVYREHNVHIVQPCTIGILHAPQDDTTPQEIIDDILLTTHNAKNNYSTNFVEFSSSVSQEYREQSEIAMALQYSVDHNYEGFRIVVQPQVRTQTRDIYGSEVLLRWEYNGHNVSPAKFIPILEQLGLIIPVGKWVVTQIMRTCQEIVRYAPDFKLSFNVSYLQVLDPSFFTFIHQTMLSHKVLGRNLMIELTESHFDEVRNDLARFFEQCNKVGISLILDDFGTAYSSLHLLLQYPATLIKLDRTLMCELISSQDKLEFMTNIIHACHRFGKKVCVEGVETENDYKIIRQTDCDYIQGYYFYRPLELPDFYNILRSQNGPAIQD